MRGRQALAAAALLAGALAACGAESNGRGLGIGRPPEVTADANAAAVVPAAPAQVRVASLWLLSGPASSAEASGLPEQEVPMILSSAPAAPLSAWRTLTLQTASGELLRVADALASEDAGEAPVDAVKLAGPAAWRLARALAAALLPATVGGPSPAQGDVLVVTDAHTTVRGVRAWAAQGQEVSPDHPLLARARADRLVPAVDLEVVRLPASPAPFPLPTRVVPAP